ncbi:Putative MDM10-complementing protein [Septoria linicola]|uniref:MDM10-complementing protein n=1 Tax=Septoria linicola TaxID=215465 RepID=A0A9Q9B0Y0_9PEZI|nr:putative MDM10-complementing protein [Septoria linicola]USW55281.1 Putative MDM10-complementing protein [Septoria linicola]
MSHDIDELEKLASGLHELEPIPTDTTSLDDASSISSGKKPHLSRSSTTGLGLSQHSALWYLTRVQKYSSYVFTAFAAMHITNTSIIPLITQSVPASEPYLLLTRPYYQSPAAEPIMIALPLWGHILSGVAIRVIRRNQNARRYGDAYSRENQDSFFTNKFWPKVSGTSKLGYLFIPLALGHIVLNRAIPQAYKSGGGNVDLAYVSHAFAKHPIVSYAGFAALLSVGCWHFTWGFAKYFGWLPEQVTEYGGGREVQKKRRWYVINAIAAAVTGIWMAGSFGVVARGGEAPGWIGREYNEMYKMIPIVGRWM